MASTERGERRRTYAEWYVWAARNLSSTVEIRHACAEAAAEAKESGGDPAAAARSAAQNRSGPGWTNQADPAVRSYAEWYDWARTTLNLSGEALHTAAAAAIIEMERGGNAAGAAEAVKRSAAGTPAAAEPTPAALEPAPGGPPPLPSPATTSAPWTPPPPPAVPPPAPPAAWTPPPPPAGPPAASPGAWTPPPPPNAMAGWAPPPPPPSATSSGADVPPAPGYLAAPPPTNAYGPSPYPVPAASASGPVQVPIWVAILLGIGCGISLLFGIVYALVLIQPDNTQDVVIGSWIVGGIASAMFGSALAALVGIIGRKGWARVLSIVAGAVFCLSCAGILFGVPVIIGAAMARPAAQRN